MINLIQEMINLTIVYILTLTSRKLEKKGATCEEDEVNGKKNYRVEFRKGLDHYIFKILEERLKENLNLTLCKILDLLKDIN